MLTASAQASNFPLSIVTIGIGDGPWDAMERCVLFFAGILDRCECSFDDLMPAGRKWDNFQFCPFRIVQQKEVSMHESIMACLF